MRCVLSMHLLRGRGSHTLTETFGSAVGVGGDSARVLGDVSEDGFQDGQVDGLSALRVRKTHVSGCVRKLTGAMDYSRGKWGVGAR